jgi:predicted methyltransferase
VKGTAAMGLACVIAISVAAAQFLRTPPAPPAAPAVPALRASPALPAVPAQSNPKNRLFPPQDLGLIEPPDREQWQPPDQIMDALNIAEGAVVAELGAGGGWFTIQLARRVGSNGVVYAEDVQPAMIEAIRRRAQRENLNNVRTVLGTARDPTLPHGIDAVLIVGAYHEMECAAGPSCQDPVALLKNVAQSLKPQGRLGVVDFNPGDGGPGRAADERPDPAAVIRAAAAAGLRLIKHEQIPPFQFQFLLVFGKGSTVPTSQ